jgi:TonB-linked SusC/RagA family outer membrane protein
MTRDFASSNRYNLNVTGGTNFAKYFGSFAYTHEGDLLNSEMETESNYKAKYAFDRFNFRTNLDLNISPTTVFSVNLAGYLGIKHNTRIPSEYDLWRAFYNTPPSAFPPRHQDGTWGFTPSESINNPVRMLNSNGIDKTFRTQVTTDFILKQDLKFILDGLSANGSFSFDNEIYSNSGIWNTTSLAKHIAPDGTVTYSPNKGVNEFDWVFRPNWKDPERIRSEDLDKSYRRLFYQIQLNYAKKFGAHDLGVTALLNRENYAKGDMFPRYREDWVGRVTYNYNGKYLFETNGAYNGSEKFGKGYRFGFFPSLAVGWLVSNESFMEQFTWLNKFKVRYSIGKIGSDNIDNVMPRWAYDTNWGIDGGGNTYFGYPSAVLSPFTQYKENVVGNPDLHWEVARKQNLGFEFGFLKNMFQMNLDVFKEDREDIFIPSGSRNIPAYFGASPVAANLGKTKSWGYEFELQFRKSTAKDFTYFANYSITYAKDEVIYREDPEMMPDYMKSAGFQIGQTKTNIATDFINNWDDAYAAVKTESNINFRLPGDIAILDYNGDGIINSFDNAPYGFPSRPQYTYNFMLGTEFKGFSVMVQFYGIFNTTRSHGFSPVKGNFPVNWEFVSTDYWTPDNTDPRWVAPRVESSSNIGHMSFFDGSYLRLKTAEIAYTFEKNWIKKLSLSSLKVYVNGNNLFFWSDLPEDRENTVGNTGGSTSLYPTLRRVNIGLSANF